MPIRAELRVTARGLKLLSKLSAGPTRARAVAQTAINSTLKRSKPKAVRAVRAQVALPRAPDRRADRRGGHRGHARLTDLPDKC